MSEQVKKMFAQIAGRYDLLNHLLSFNIDKSWRRKTVNTLTKSKNDPLVILDLCAGTLDLTLEIAKQFPQATIYAVDFCYPMLSNGFNKIKPEDRARIHLCCGDALKLPFTDHFFDAVFCGYGFRNLDNAKLATVEFLRILKNNGGLYILDFFKPESRITKVFHATYGRYLLPLLGSVVAANKEAYVYLNKSVDGFMSTHEAIQLLNSNGFKNAQKRDLFMGISSLVYANT